MTPQRAPCHLDPTVEELFEQAPCGYVTWFLHGGTIVRVNGTFLSLGGYGRDEVVDRCTFGDLLTTASRVFYDSHLLPLLHVQGWVKDVSLMLATSGGGERPVLLSCTVRTGGDGAPVAVRASVSDATERHGLEHELRRSRLRVQRSEEQVRFLQQVTADLVHSEDSGSAVEVLVAAATRTYRGASTAVWLRSPADDTLARADRSVMPPPRLAPTVVRAGAPSPVDQACRERRVVPVGSVQDARGWPGLEASMVESGVQSLVCVPLSTRGRVVGVFQITFRRQRSFDHAELAMLATLGLQVGQALERLGLDDRLRHLALHDALTDVPNRALFEDRVQQALTRSRRSGAPVTVMFLDVDGFKTVNDSLGPRAGDELLVEVARRLVSCVRASDTTARLGGDEFALLMEGVALPEALQIAEDLKARVREPARLSAGEALVTASVGVVVHDPAADGLGDPQALIRDAGDAMHTAKVRGRDRHEVYDTELRGRAVREAATRAALRRGLQQDDLVLHYQPVFDLVDGSVHGVEALCRLRDGDDLLLPGAFIPLAEASGLVVPLGAQVLRRALAQMRCWDDEGRRPVLMSVNVAAAQAAQPGFADGVLRLLTETGTSPERLVLELTESVLLLATPTTLAGLDRLRRHGVGIALDDFGTRYASLNYVQQFPLTALKVDRSFVGGLPSGRAERAIVRAVAQMARDLGVTCTAEGIETVEQEEFLRGLRLLGQGFLLSRPLSADDCAVLLGR